MNNRLVRMYLSSPFWFYVGWLLLMVVVIFGAVLGLETLADRVQT